MEEKRISVPSLFMLLIAGLAVAAFRSADGLTLSVLLVASWTAFLMLFLAQGYLASWAVAIGILFIGLTPASESGDPLTRLHDLLLLAAVAMTYLHWSALNEIEFRPKFWILLAVGQTALAAFTWQVAERTGDGDWDGYERIHLLALGMPVLGGLLGVLFRIGLPRRSWKAIGTGFLVALLAPVVGFGVAQAGGTLNWETIRPGDEWRSWPGQFSEWMWAIGDGSADLRAWCWWIPWVVLTTAGIGLLQRVWWGFTEYRTKRAMPFSWLTAAVCVGLVGVFGPASDVEAAKVAMMFPVFVLSVSMIVEVPASLARGLQRTVPEQE